MKAASCRSAKAAYLMREALSRNQCGHQRPSVDGLEGSVPDEGGNQSQSGSVLGGGREVDGKQPLKKHEPVGHVRLDLCIPPPLGGCGDVVAP